MILTRRSLLALGGATLAGLAAGAPALASAVRLTRKKGLAGAAPSASGLRTSWYYDWSVRPATKGVPADDPSIRFYPMVWGLSGHTDAALAAMRARRLPVLFTFNEPDGRGQSNLTVEQALAAWPTFDGMADDLVGPSCVHPDGPWMRRFMDGADKARFRVDSVGIHNYGSADPHGFIGLLQHVHDLYGRPVWVTEFAVADWHAKNGIPNRYSERDVIRFIETVCPFMERTDWVHGYSWYPWCHAGGPGAPSACFRPDGTLTGVGEAYAAI